MKKKGKEKEVKPPPDIARLGIFKEEPYIAINTRYVPLDTLVWNESAQSGKQIQISTPGYFSKFRRAFEGDAPTDGLRAYRRERRKTKEKYFAGEFICSSPGKKIQGSGHYSGTFRGPIRAFRPNVRKEARPESKKNIKIQPPKRGCGYEVIDCGINAYPKAMDPREIKQKVVETWSEDDPLFYYFKTSPDYIHQNPYYINPVLLTKRTKLRPVDAKLRLARMSTPTPFKIVGRAKKIGGNKDGCFTMYTPYLTHTERPGPYKIPNGPPMFTMGAKSSIFNSTIQTNVKKHVTPVTYKNVEGVMYLKPKTKIASKNHEICK